MSMPPDADTDSPVQIAQAGMLIIQDALRATLIRLWDEVDDSSKDAWNGYPTCWHLRQNPGRLKSKSNLAAGGARHTALFIIT